MHAALEGQENSNTSSARPRSPPRPQRQINFSIHSQKGERSFPIEESSLVGTLLQGTAGSLSGIESANLILIQPYPPVKIQYILP